MQKARWRWLSAKGNMDFRSSDARIRVFSSIGL